jgi:hypothetical protein
MANLKFATAINCMDGRVQLPVINHLKTKFSVDCVDIITEPAPVKIISESSKDVKLESIKERLKISQEKHGSEKLAIVAHHDCAGNPVEKTVQLDQLRNSIRKVRSWGFRGVLLGLWLDENWAIQEIEEFK